MYNKNLEDIRNGCVIGDLHSCDYWEYSKTYIEKYLLKILDENVDNVRAR